MISDNGVIGNRLFVMTGILTFHRVVARGVYPNANDLAGDPDGAIGFGE